MRNTSLSLRIAARGFWLTVASLSFVQQQNRVKAEGRQVVPSNTATVASATTPSAKILLARLRTISGKEAKDCGTTSVTKPDAAVSDCGLKAFEDHKAFFLSYHRQYGEDLWFGYGLAGNPVGDVFTVTYQIMGFPAVAPTRHTQLMDDNYTRAAECIKPVRLERTTEGLLACVTPVNRKESDKVAHQKPVETTVCAVLENPAAFNNKLVRIRGHFSGSFEYSMLSGNDCGSLWFEYGDGEGSPSLAAYVPGGAMPGSEDSQGMLILPVPVRIVHDARLKRFERQTQAMAKADADWEQEHPHEYVHYCVTATFIGRIDAVSSAIHEFRKKQKPDGHSDRLGFGHMGLFEAQLVVQSVVDDALLRHCK